MKKLLVLFVVFSHLMMALSGISAQDACPPGSVPNDAPAIVFGAAVSETGKYAPEGGDILNGYNLWLDWVNNEYGGINVGGVCHQARLIAYDDQSDPDTASVLIEQLIIEDQANFILGPYTTTLAQAASVIAERENVILMESSGTDESLYSRGFQNLFAIFTPAAYYTQTAIEHAFNLGARTAVIAYEDTTFPAAVAQSAREQLDSLGIQILAIERYPKNSTDLTSMFTSFRELNPDLFIGSGNYNDALLFVLTAKALGFSPDAFFIPVGPSNPAFVGVAGADAEYIWSASQWTSSMPYEDDFFGTAADYAARYEQSYGILPSDQAAEATASLLTLQVAIEAAGTTDTDSVRSALQELSIMTFYGPIQFDSTGQSANIPAVTVQIQNGQVEVIAPSDAAEATTIWPAPTWEER